MFYRILIALFLLLPTTLVQAGPGLEYRFARLWPALQQPWYFGRAGCVAEDELGNVYVPDGQNDLLRKFSRDGSLISQWGNQGSEAERLNEPQCVVLGPDNLLYVSGAEHVRIYNTDGEFQRWLGGFGENCPGRFNNPSIVGFDSLQRLFVLDTLNHRVQRFENLGLCLDGFANYDPLDAETFPACKLPAGNACSFSWPVGDPMNINDRPRGMVVLSTPGVDQVFVSETDLNRVVRFDTNGGSQAVIAGPGTGPGQVDLPGGLSLGPNGQLFVADFGNSRIQVLDTDGNFLREIAGSVQNDINRFSTPNTVTALANGEYYVTDETRIRVLRFDSNEQLTAKWASAGSTPGRFWQPGGLSIGTDTDTDMTRKLFVADELNNRIQVFTLDGNLDRVMTSFDDGGSPRNFVAPTAILIDSGFLYLQQDFGRLDKFDLANLSRIWSLPDLAAIDPNNPLGGPCTGIPNNGFGQALALHGGELFAADTDVRDSLGNQLPARVRRLNPANGNCMSDIGVGILTEPKGLAVVAPTGGNRRLWVTDSDPNNTFANIKLFDPATGAQTNTFGDLCVTTPCGAGRFQRPSGLSVIDPDTAAPKVVVTESNVAFAPADFPLRIQVFEADGTFVTGFGSTGVGTDQFESPNHVATDAQGNIFVSDRLNNRLQKFTAEPRPGNARAILVAGGGPYPGNALWSATQSNANFAFTALASRGFTKDSMQYLSADTDLDLDQNGQADEVDADATSDALQLAILGPAGDGSNGFAGDPGIDHLVVYLLDHGGENAFRVSATDVLTPDTLDGWLRSWQQTHPGAQLTIIYDACQSGSFLDELAAPDRVVVTSASGSENAYFVSQGTLSFSNLFWSQIFLGLELDDAFSLAANAITEAFPKQHPQLEATGDNTANTAADLLAADGRSLGSGSLVQGDRPQMTGTLINGMMGSVTINGTNSATVTAEGVTDNDGIARVWVVMRPPGFDPGSASNPVNDLPTFDLKPTTGNDFAATFDGFSDPGLWQLTVYALDDLGNVGIPRSLTLSVGNPLTRKAIVVGGGTSGDPGFSARLLNTNRAYRALDEQGYGPQGASCPGGGGVCDTNCDNVCYLTDAGSAGFDVAPNLNNLMDAVTNWGANGVQDLTIYLVPEANGSGGYRLNGNPADDLDAATLAGWLDTAQATLPGTVTLILEGDDSESFLADIATLTAGEQILVGSTASGETAVLLQGGRISFSHYFWTQVLNGATVRQGFRLASSALAFDPANPVPQLDDDGDGVPNGLFDGLRAVNYTIGAGILLAGDDPLVGSVIVNSVLSSDFETLRAASITTTRTIDRVVAVVSQPGGKRVEQLLPVTGNTYSDRSFGLCGPAGMYTIGAYAIDTAGNVSLPAIATANRAVACIDFQFASGFE